MPIVEEVVVNADMQYGFRSLLFGANTDYQTETVEGIIGMPSARTGDEPNQEDHGDHAGVDLLPGRTVTINMNILGVTGSTFQTKIDAFTKAFQVARRNAFIEFPFVTRRPGHTKRFLWARARRSEIPSNYDTARGKARAGVQLYATDPRWYSVAHTTTDIITADGGAAAQAEVPMLGDLEDGTMPLIEIQGPCTNPRITNEEDAGRTIRIDIVIPVGQTLYIDTKAKTVFLQAVDRFDTVRGDNQWWRLIPGNNTVVYNRSGGGVGSRCRVIHHDAWTSA